MKLYVYVNLINQSIQTSDCNFWYTKESQETGLYKTNDVLFKLLDTLEIDLSGYTFNFQEGKIQALELQLGDLHVKSENIKAQIQELKCIGHDSNEEVNKTTPIRNFRDFDQFDDDLPF